MTYFEEVTCKVLGGILFLLVIIIGLQLMGCTCSIPDAPLEYEYIDEVETNNLV